MLAIAMVLTGRTDEPPARQLIGAAPLAAAMAAARLELGRERTSRAGATAPTSAPVDASAAPARAETKC